MTDTQLLDFIESAIKAREADVRYPPSYICILGNVNFALSCKEPRTFRELVAQACIDQITERLKGD